MHNFKPQFYRFHPKSLFCLDLSKINLINWQRIYTHDNVNKSYSSPASAKNDQLQVRERDNLHL